MLVPRGDQRLLDALVFSGVWVALIAAGLTLASARVIAPTLPAQRVAELLALAFAGTLVVYAVDRLRDLERDRTRSPARSRFVEENRYTLVAMTIGAAALCIPLAARQPRAAWPLCGAVLGFGLLHRRLKTRPIFKVAYVTLAWLAVVVGLPVVNSGRAGLDLAALASAVASFGTALAANLIAMGLRKGQGSRGRLRLRASRSLAAGGALLAPVLGSAFWPLGLIPAAELAALMGFRRDERYRLVVVDGALLLGALAAAALLTQTIPDGCAPPRGMAEIAAPVGFSLTRRGGGS